MHKKLLNEAAFSLTIQVEGPLLVKSGTEGWNPTTPDMEFVRTHHAQLGETVFIPGSSLKGTLRSYSEKIARTLDVFCCDPFDKKESCSQRQDLKRYAEIKDAKGIYQKSCVACKLYGSTNMAGRAAFADAYPRADVSRYLTKRTAVAIDRVLGSVAVGPFDFEALMRGEFTTLIRLRNFELWQLGLLGLAVRDFCLGRIHIGYGKSRGFGSVTAKLDRLEIRSLADQGIAVSDGKLIVKGIGALLAEGERSDYGIREPASSMVSITTGLKPIEDFVGASVIFERTADSPDWCAAEAHSLFSQAVKDWWAAYRQEHRRK